MAVEDIANFLPIDERIGTAGQPSETELRDAAAAGYTAVINLGLLDPRYCLPDEAGLVQSLGLRYRHIPVQFDAPTVEDFRIFLSSMQECAAERVLVHCAANYRVSSFMAVYGEIMLGWTREQADAHARTLWPLNDTWSDFLDECRREFTASVTTMEGATGARSEIRKDGEA
ncbi:MAG: protein tyrosine phosphatase family protein [Candidatus Binatia bacterium]